MKKTSQILVIILLIITNVYAQNVGINNSGANPNESAMLDVASANKGILIPQIALTGANDASTILSPAVSLLVYNTATVSGLTPGYYYNAGTVNLPVWTRLATGIIDGSETKITSGANITISGLGTTSSPYVINASSGGGSALAIGDSYGGGKIFWIDASGQHGLIAATSDQSSGIIWNSSYTTTGATLSAVYAGNSNTNLIISIQGNANYAAKLCADYTVIVNNEYYDDWYLPSGYELSLLYAQKIAVGGFSNTYYWSSTEMADYGARRLNFGTGVLNDDTKNSSYRVRAIRAF